MGTITDNNDTLERFVIRDSAGNELTFVNSVQVPVTIKNSSGTEPLISTNATDARGIGNSNSILVTSMPALWNGAAWDRPRGVNTGQQVVTIKDSAGNELFNSVANRGYVHLSNGTYESDILPNWAQTAGYAALSTNGLAVTAPILILDPSNVLQHPRADSSNNLKTSTELKEREVARGNVTGEKVLDKFGVNDTIGTSYEDVISLTGTLNYLLYTNGTAQPFEIVSNSAQDGVAGAGALTVEVSGVDTNGDEITQNITMNGTTPVSIPTSMKWVHRAKVLTTGTNNVNVGTITISTTAAATPASTAYLQIDPDEGQTLHAVYYVPNDYTNLEITRVEFSSGAGDDLRFQLQTFEGTSSSWRTKISLDVYQKPYAREMERSPLIVPANSLVRIRAKSNAVGAGTKLASATFQGQLK